jgi:hypothetical protein
MNRPAGGASAKWDSTYRCAMAAHSAAVAPIPTEPVEKSTVSGSLIRLG